MDYKQLKELFCRHECENPETHLTAYITFSSFGPGNKNDYDWKGRTYVISSDNKAFQTNKGGYSIFGSCLDGSDQFLRLERYMREEQGGEDGWTVGDCCIIGYLLIECSDINISAPRLFYSKNDAMECMLSQLAEKGELDLEQLKKDYSAMKELAEDGRYGVERDSAWLADSCEDWHWNIQSVCIYDPLHIVFGHE